MTRHRRRRHSRLVDPRRTLMIALLISAGLGGVLASPAGQPTGDAGHVGGRAPQNAPPSPTPSGDHRPGRDADRDSVKRADPTETPSQTQSPRPDESGPAEPDPRTPLEDEVTRLTNLERVEAGCDPLRTDERLRVAARGHSQDMANRQYFAHDSPEGETPWERAEAAGYPRPSAENIAHGYPDAEAVVAAWMGSDGHRANILNCDSRATGVGVALTGAGAPYWTQMFGYE